MNNEVFAQKKNIDSSAYRNWKTISDPKISSDGQWVVYSYRYLYSEDKPSENNPVILFNTKTGKEIKLKDASQYDFFNNGKWIRYSKAIGKKTITILECLKTGEKINWSRPIYFQTNKKSPYIVYSYTPNKKGYAGRRLVLFNVERKDSICYDNLLDYKLFKYNTNIIYVQGKNKFAYLKYEKGLRKPATLFKVEKDSFGQLSLDNSGNYGSFTLTKKNHEIKSLYEFSLKDYSVKHRMDFDNIQSPIEDYTIDRMNYDTYGLSVIFPGFRKKNNRNNFKKKTKDEAGVDIWKWNEGAMDRRLSKIGREKQISPNKYSYLINENRFVQLTLNSEESIIKPTKGNFEHVFVLDPVPYAVDLDWTFEQLYDIYVVDVKTGNRRLILKKSTDQPIWSPGGDFAVIFNSTKKIWEKIDIKNNEIRFVDLTKDIPYPVYDEDYDMPLSVPPYGLAGWLYDNKTMVVYDKYDLWAVDVTGKKKAFSITCNYGRSHKIKFRLSKQYVTGLNLNKLQLISFDEQIKSRGIYQLNKGKLKSLIEGEFNAKLVAFLPENNSILWSKESYRECPDLWWSDIKRKKNVRISEINPQQNNLRWGKTQLFTWTDNNGEKNEGVLYLPEDYEPGKKYPTIVYFYEKSSNERFLFKYPDYSESSLNIPTYVSNGYIIFQPDIRFKIGHTGESSCNIVVSGAKELIKKGIADPEHIGIHGHSFGAYQTGYITTQTDMFTCSVPASLVTNLTSNYTSLRANGLANMFMYESGQMRMGKSMYDDMESYIKNSTIFHVKKIHTPMLIFHCDNDNAVPFYEGRSLFLAMRRFRKPVWLINYKGQAHDLYKMAFKKDWTKRLQEFFDYYLKDGTRPSWMDL